MESVSRSLLAELLVLLLQVEGFGLLEREDTMGKDIAGSTKNSNNYH